MDVTPPKSLLCICSRQKHEDNNDLQSFLSKNLPIFWIMGPPSCGKTTLAEMLAQSSKYHLLKVSSLLTEDSMKRKWRGKFIFNYLDAGRKVPNEIIVHLLKEALLHSYDSCTGYVIDGFPANIRQAKLFEKEICKVSMIIYVTLILDALLARKITQVGAFDPNEERIRYLSYSKRLNEIAKKYDQKTLKINSNYPPEDTCTRLVENLEDFWGYKFLRLYNKNQ